MKHASAPALDRLEPLLAAVRAAHPDLRERSRGVFYRRSSAFLHFHEDPQGLFADVKGPERWERFDVTLSSAYAAFLARVAAVGAAAVGVAAVGAARPAGPGNGRGRSGETRRPRW